MANNKIQVKRTNVAGRTPNTSDPANTQYISTGELALNMTDGLLFTSNGSALIEVGANNTTQTVSTNNLTVGNTLYVVANGNVGVGNSTPNDKLFVDGKANTQSIKLFRTGLGLYDNVIDLSLSGNYWRNDGALSASSFTIELTNQQVLIKNAEVRLLNTGKIGFSNGNPISFAADSYWTRDAAGIIAQKDGANSQSSRLYGTYTDGSNYERLSFTANSTAYYVYGERAGTGSVRPLYLGTNNATQVSIFANNTVALGSLKFNSSGDSGNVNLSGENAIEFSGSATIRIIHSDGGGFALKRRGGSNTLSVDSSQNINFLNGKVYFSNSSGNVGIGNTTPAHKLRVEGDISLSGGIHANGGVGTAGQVLTSNGTTVYWSTVASGGGVYMKGGTATVGTLASEGQNIFRVNANTLNNNTTIAAGENAQATGPIAVAAGITLTVETGARVSIV